MPFLESAGSVTVNREEAFPKVRVAADEALLFGAVELRCLLLPHRFHSQEFSTPIFFRV